MLRRDGRYGWVGIRLTENRARRYSGSGRRVDIPAAAAAGVRGEWRTKRRRRNGAMDCG